MAKIVVFDEESRRALERGVTARGDVQGVARHLRVGVSRAVARALSFACTGAGGDADAAVCIAQLRGHAHAGCVVAALAGFGAGVL